MTRSSLTSCAKSLRICCLSLLVGSPLGAVATESTKSGIDGGAVLFVFGSCCCCLALVGILGPCLYVRSGIAGGTGACMGLDMGSIGDAVVSCVWEVDKGCAGCVGDVDTCFPGGFGGRGGLSGSGGLLDVEVGTDVEVDSLSLINPI